MTNHNTTGVVESTEVKAGYSAKEWFCMALDTFVQFPDKHHASELARACGKVWNDATAMPLNTRPDVEATLENYVEFDQWESKGWTYAGAAQRISQILKSKYPLDGIAA